MRQADVIKHVLDRPMPYFFSSPEIEDIKAWQKPLYDNIIQRKKMVPFYNKWSDKPYSIDQINEFGYNSFIYSLAGPGSVESRTVIDDSADGDIIGQEFMVGTTGKVTSYLFSGFLNFHQSALLNYLCTQYVSMPEDRSIFSYLFRVKNESSVMLTSTAEFLYNPNIYKYPYGQVRTTKIEELLPDNERHKFTMPEFYMHNNFSHPMTCCSLVNMNLLIRSVKKRCSLLISPSQADVLISIENSRQTKMEWTANEYCPIVISSLETLNDSMKQKMQNYFGKNTFIMEHHFHSNGGSQIWKCPKGVWHLWPFCVAEQSKNGELITTNLVSQRSIWDKYNTENIISGLRWGKCDCGFTGQMFDTYEGRHSDVIIVDNRCFMTYHIYANIHHDGTRKTKFSHVQVVQKESGDIEVFAVPEKNAIPGKEEFTKICREFFGTTKCIVTVVNELPFKDKHNRIKPIVSYLNKHELKDTLLSCKEN